MTGRLTTRPNLRRQRWRDETVELKLLEFTVTFSALTHVEHILVVANQWMHIWRVKGCRLSCDALHIFTVIIDCSHLQYAVPSFAGQLSVEDQARFQFTVFQKTFRRGFLAKSSVPTSSLSGVDTTILWKMSDVRHCPHALLPKKTQLRILPQIELILLKKFS